MRIIPRIGLAAGLAAAMLAGSAPGQAPSGAASRPVNVLVLLGEWFGDAYFPLAKEIEARGWTMKRVGLDGEYRGCYNKKRDVVAPQRHRHSGQEGLRRIRRPDHPERPAVAEVQRQSDGPEVRSERPRRGADRRLLLRGEHDGQSRRPRRPPLRTRAVPGQSDFGQGARPPRAPRRRPSARRRLRERAHQGGLRRRGPRAGREEGRPSRSPARSMRPCGRATWPRSRRSSPRTPRSSTRRTPGAGRRSISPATSGNRDIIALPHRQRGRRQGGRPGRIFTPLHWAACGRAGRRGPGLDRGRRRPERPERAGRRTRSNRPSMDGSPEAVEALLQGRPEGRDRGRRGRGAPPSRGLGRVLVAGRISPEERGRSPPRPTSMEGRLLHSAASGGLTSMVEKLIAGGANINAADDVGQTPLHLAAAAGRQGHGGQAHLQGRRSEGRLPGRADPHALRRGREAWSS